MMAAHDSDWSVDKLLDVSSGYWKSCALHAAVSLGLFTVLHDQWLTAAQIAEKIKGAARGVTVLLNGLVAMGLLDKRDDERYGNTHFSESVLDESSPQYKGYIIMHHHHLVDGWAQLDQAVLQGRPVEMRSYGEEAERHSFQMGMFNLAMDNAPRVAGLVNLEGRNHLLDLGGGPGTYAVHFCLANPPLRATVFDRPTTRAFAMKTAERFGVGERITFQAGDFNGDAIPGRYDVAWLSQILHSNGPEACERLIAKTVEAMEPGGLLMIHEFFLNESMDGPLFPALFSLNMLINNEEGRSYSDREIREMLAVKGVRDIHRLPLYQGPNESYVLCGTVL
jgi:hypothetical protein